MECWKVGGIGTASGAEMIEKPTTEETKMNDEDEVDANGKPTERAVESMTLGVSSTYGFYYRALAAGDASKAAYWADKVREDMGGLLQTIGKALGDL